MAAGRCGFPLSLHNIYSCWMYSKDYLGEQEERCSVVRTTTPPDGCVILRQYLIPNNPNSRICQAYKRANPNGGILIPVVSSINNNNNSNMGAFLDKPRTEKSNESGQGSGLNYGIAAMQGWRAEMEDAHTARVGLTTVLNDWSFFAVFDGHAGGNVAKYCASNLLESILDTPELKEFLSSSSCSAVGNHYKLDQSQLDCIERGIKRGFVDLDERMRRLPTAAAAAAAAAEVVNGEGESGDKSGTTVICALISPSHIFLANLGDSRALFSRNGRLQLATVDHKPYVPKERDRIVNAGGSVLIQRVNGSLAVSRALGDYEYKNAPKLGPCQQMVSPEPEVHVLERDGAGAGGKDEFLLLACDGVFDVMENADVCDFVRNRLRITDRLELICNQVLDASLSKGSKDNMSVILVTFPGAPKISKEAVDKEKREFENILRERICAILNIPKDSASSSACAETKIDIDHLMRVLTMGDSYNFLMQKAGGIESLRTFVQSILDSLTPGSCATASGADSAPPPPPPPDQVPLDKLLVVDTGSAPSSSPACSSAECSSSGGGGSPCSSHRHRNQSGYQTCSGDSAAAGQSGAPTKR